MNNSTNATTPSQRGGGGVWGSDLFKRLYYSYCTTSSLYILVGTPLCLWFMAAILTSPNMRRRLRNQLLCAIWLAYMLKSTLSGGLEMSLFASSVEGKLRFNCYLYSLFLNLRIICEFAGSWLVVNLLMVYLAQVFDYDPTSTFTPMVVTMGKGALVVLPFALAIIFVPSIGVLTASNYAKRNPGCIMSGKIGYLVLRSLDFMVPMLISIVLLIVAAVFYYRRYHQGFSSSSSSAMQTELMGRGRQVDNVAAYLVAIFIDIGLRIPSSLYVAELRMNPEQRLLYNFISWMILDSRSIILPWCWLLLEDIRERIKIWRPWYRPAPGIDLTVTYSREEHAGK